ncbi:MAG TPA: hypothetical protein PLQ04_04645 [Lachnospiraceae bacterium]|nr:hypothetical protein [Lachnospiraceae bacterium]
MIVSTEDAYKRIWDKNQMFISIAQKTDDKEHRDLLTIYNKVNAFLSYGAQRVFKEDQTKEFRSEMWAALAQRTLNHNVNITLDRLRKHVNAKLPASVSIWDCVIVLTSYFRSVDEMKAYAKSFAESIEDLNMVNEMPEIIPYSVYLANQRKDQAVEDIKEVDSRPAEVNMRDVDKVDSLMSFENMFKSSDAKSMVDSVFNNGKE